jgi:hypothetical protein
MVAAALNEVMTGVIQAAQDQDFDAHGSSVGLQFLDIMAGDYWGRALEEET